METIVAIDLGKRKSVVCTMDRGFLGTDVWGGLSWTDTAHPKTVMVRGFSA